MRYLIIVLGLFTLAGCEDPPPPSDPTLDKAYEYVSQEEDQEERKG